MTKDDIRDAVKIILSEIAPDEDLSDLEDDVEFREQLDLDSMDFLDIVMELVDVYGGSLDFKRSQLGGLLVELRLPTARLGGLVRQTRN